MIGTHSNAIHDRALKKSWDLPTLCREGSEIAGEKLNKLGKYSYNNIKNRQNTSKEAEDYKKNIT